MVTHDQVKQSITTIMNFANGIVSIPFFTGNATIKQVVLVCNQFATQDWFIDILVVLINMAQGGATPAQLHDAVKAHMAASPMQSSMPVNP